MVSEEQLKLIKKSKNQYILSLIAGNIIQSFFIFLIFVQVATKEDNMLIASIVMIFVLLPFGFFLGYQPYKAYIQMRKMVKEYVKENSNFVFILISGKKILCNSDDIILSEITFTYIIGRDEIQLMSFFIKSKKVYYYYWIRHYVNLIFYN